MIPRSSLYAASAMALQAGHNLVSPALVACSVTVSVGISHLLHSRLSMSCSCTLITRCCLSADARFIARRWGLLDKKVASGRMGIIAARH